MGVSEDTRRRLAVLEDMLVQVHEGRTPPIVLLEQIVVELSAVIRSLDEVPR